MENKFSKWNKWLDSIYIEIINLSKYRNIYKEVQNIIYQNQRIQKPSIFYEFIGVSYSTLILMGIRRLCKTHKDSISFATLLEEIQETPSILCRERYVSLYNGSDVKHLADGNFNKFSGKVGNHVDPDLVKNDYEKLIKKAELCEKYTDMRIAHFDKKKPKTIPTFKDVNDCIDLLEELLIKYFALFRAESLTRTIPVIQYDWKAIFREPWIT